MYIYITVFSNIPDLIKELDGNIAVLVVVHNVRMYACISNKYFFLF